METSVLQKQFARIGARLKVNVRSTVRRTRFTGFAVDIGRDGHGPFFDVTLGKDAERELEVLDVQPGQRHLLLLVREPNGRREEKHKFLCGHDERDWFAAAVPETVGRGDRPHGHGGPQASGSVGGPGPQGTEGTAPQPASQQGFHPAGGMVLHSRAGPGCGPEAGAEQRAAGTWARQAALGRVPLPERRSERLRLLRVPAGTQRVGPIGD